MRVEGYRYCIERFETGVCYIVEPLCHFDISTPLSLVFVKIILSPWTNQYMPA